MNPTTFLLLLVIAGASALVHTLIIGWPADQGWRAWVGRFLAYAMLLTLPALLPKLLGG